MLQVCTKLRPIESFVSIQAFTCFKECGDKWAKIRLCIENGFLSKQIIFETLMMQSDYSGSICKNNLN